MTDTAATLITVAEAAKRLGCVTATVYQLIRADRLTKQESEARDKNGRPLQVLVPAAQVAALSKTRRQQRRRKQPPTSATLKRVLQDELRQARRRAEQDAFPTGAYWRGRAELAEALLQRWK